MKGNGESFKLRFIPADERQVIFFEGGYACGEEISAEPGSTLGREARFFEYHLGNYVLCVCAWATDDETGAPCCTFAPHEGGLAHHG